MKRLVTAEELETLGNLLVREYLKKTRKYKALCFDIEAFITDFLNVRIEFETFAEEDSGKTGCQNQAPGSIAFFKSGITMSNSFPMIERLRDRTFLLPRIVLNACKRNCSVKEVLVCAHDGHPVPRKISQARGFHS